MWAVKSLLQFRFTTFRYTTPFSFSLGLYARYQAGNRSSRNTFHRQGSPMLPSSHNVYGIDIRTQFWRSRVWILLRVEIDQVEQLVDTIM